MAALTDVGFCLPRIRLCLVGRASQYRPRQAAAPISGRRLSLASLPANLLFGLRRPARCRSAANRWSNGTTGLAGRAGCAESCGNIGQPGHRPGAPAGCGPGRPFCRRDYARRRGKLQTGSGKLSPRCHHVGHGTGTVSGRRRFVAGREVGPVRGNADHHGIRPSGPACPGSTKGSPGAGPASRARAARRRERTGARVKRSNRRMNLVIFGLAISSSWGNGHAALWRGLVKALSRGGHRVVFFERDTPWYAAHRDLVELPRPGRLVLYHDWTTVRAEARRTLASADAAIVTSDRPDARPATRLLLDSNVGIRCFYDLDTPVTLARVAAGESVEYLPGDGLGAFDLVLSYSGGKALRVLRTRLGARRVAPLYGSVDPELHHPAAPRPHYAAGTIVSRHLCRRPSACVGDAVRRARTPAAEQDVSLSAVRNIRRTFHGRPTSTSSVISHRQSIPRSTHPPA